MIRCISLWVIASSLAAAPAAIDIASAVDRAGRLVEKFSDDFGGVTCTEMVTQAKLTPEGKLLLEKKSVFDYLMLLRLADGELNVDESRLERSVSGPKVDRPLLATAGFSTMLLVFHPHFRSSYEFSEAPEESGAPVIRFLHRKGSRSPSVLQLRGRMYPLEWRGTARVDPVTGDILRITAELVSPMSDVGLQALAITVSYSPVTLADQKLSLPQLAEIEARTVRQRWRNVHQFRDYRRFSVDARVKAETPEAKDPEKN